jgi:alanyl-tRNA synthetase
MKAGELRNAFLEYYRELDHRVVRSSPLVLPNDPTLLFANAGMNQFKDVFTGREKRSYTRAASSQKCLRVAGKHNDLETVGRTPRHHTFFEMLGNFSFGDYFKEDAIRFAWTLLTERFGIPEDRLWVSVFSGSDDFAFDEEAERIWREGIGIHPDRILCLGEKENFWRMGDTGPCGPCSEIHFDLGADLTSVEGMSTPETDEVRFLEIWNLVFMQYDQHPDEIRQLPAPSIDTGMGLERIASVLQGVRSNYDTDLFLPIIDCISTRAGIRYGKDREADDACRIIADHARALSFLVSDGIVPAPDNRGYVLRRLLRRAIRFGRKLGIREPFLHEVTPVVIDTMKDAYPELQDARDAILELGRREERRFNETLSSGMQMLEEAIDALPEESPRVLPGAEVFRLYDTFGFPLDLTRDILEERGVTMDDAGFDTAMERQRTKARESFKAKEQSTVDDGLRQLAESRATEFVGYTEARLEETEILALRKDGVTVDRLRSGEDGELILQATPFYPESGGQVGDTGRLHAGDVRLRVADTQRPVPGLIVHRVHVEHGEVGIGDRVTAEIDSKRRVAIERNHTATHLVHAALREAIGPHVKQAGSMVASERLRFDFSHFSGVSEGMLEEIEDRVSERILADDPVETEMMDLDQALKSGAMALFGEKYGDRVRVVRIGDHSRELCGGTHVARIGEIGLFKFTQERGIAAGTRRVEGTSGDTSLARMQALQREKRALEQLLCVRSDEVFEEIQRRIDSARDLERELEELRVAQVSERLDKLVKNPEKVAGVGLLTERVDGLSSREARELADRLRGKLGSGVVVLGRVDGEKASLLVAVTDDLKGRLPAGPLVKALAVHIGGGGGGRPDLAEAGGKNPSRLSEALAAAATEIENRLKE